MILINYVIYYSFQFSLQLDLLYAFNFIKTSHLNFLNFNANNNCLFIFYYFLILNIRIKSEYFSFNQTNFHEYSKSDIKEFIYL